MEILIADDEATTRQMLEMVLREWGHEVTAVVDGQRAWDLLRHPEAPKLAILDWIMPGLEGPDICRLVRQQETGRYTYIILLTIRDDKKDVVRGIDAGADDYITKPFDRDELRARVNAAQRQLLVHERLLAAQEALRREALRDPLTGIPNRAAILDTLEGELARAAREKTHLALALLDLDGFKSINDRYGHTAGDEVLIQVVRTWRSQLRGYDVIGRWGGDEFLLVLPGLTGPQALNICERLRLRVAADLANWAGHPLNTTLSVGVVATDGTFPPSRAQFVRAADEALYAAKRAGRNRVHLLENAWPLAKA